MQTARMAGRSRCIRRQYTLAALLNEQTTRADTDEPGVHRTSVPRAILLALTVIAGLFLSIAAEGPDFGHYTDWAAAALSGDIFTLRGKVLSPARSASPRDARGGRGRGVRGG